MTTSNGPKPQSQTSTPTTTNNDTPQTAALLFLSSLSVPPVSNLPSHRESKTNQCTNNNNAPLDDNKTNPARPRTLPANYRRPQRFNPSQTHSPQAPRPTVQDPLITFLSTPSNPPATHVFTSIPTYDIILTPLSQAIVASRSIPSGETKAWKKSTLNCWTTELEKLTLQLRDTIDNPSSLSVFNSIFTFCTAPGSVLAPHFKAFCPKPNPSFPSDELANDPSINAALRKIQKGQEKKAFRLLSSNGVAQINEQTIQALRDLHPPLTADLQLPTTDVTQLKVDLSFVINKLFKDSTDANISNDVYGWSAALFHHVRGQRGGFLETLAEFICLIANQPSLIHHTSALLLTSGILTPLHKTTLAEQAESKALGHLPKLRPINCGALITKTLLAAALNTPEATTAAQSTQPHQLALGTARGTERLVHTCRAAYHSNYLIGKNDFQNGFNSLSRQALLDAHCKAFPQATAIFNTIYGIKAPCFVIDTNNQLVQILSEQGSRQGCSAGSESFCLTIAPFINKLQTKYPQAEFRVITDDLFPLLPPPTSNHPDDWQHLYVTYANILNDLALGPRRRRPHPQPRQMQPSATTTCTRSYPSYFSPLPRQLRL